MLSIRLSRVGKKKQPTYRLIICRKTKDPWGDYLELLGHYNPRSNPKVVQFNAERIKYWLEKGAQPSDTVRNLLIDQKIIEGKKAKASKISQKRAAKISEKKKSKEAAAKVEAPAADLPPAVPVKEEAKEDLSSDLSSDSSSDLSSEASAKDEASAKEEALAKDETSAKEETPKE